MDAHQNVSTLMSEWASSVSRTDIPDHVRSIVRTCVIDTIGVAIAGTATPIAGMARALALQNARPGKSEILGSQATLSPMAAAFCNATASHALDFDDNCYAGFVHGSAVIVPAALALAQELGASGADLITAIAAGAECEYAVGAAAGISLYEKGWWTTGLLGPIGAGVAAGRLLDLDAEAMQSCIGFTVAGAGGTKACFGTDAKALMAGEASETGLRWALLAHGGACGPSDALLHEAGFARLHNDLLFDSGEIVTLGRHWRLVDPGIDIKKYPVCLSSHAAIDVTIGLFEREKISLDEVDQIICDVPPVVIANLKHSFPTTIREAQFSMEFSVASAACFGACGLDQLRIEVLESEAIRSLMPVVRMVSSEMWDAARKETAPEGALVKILLKDGSNYSGFCAHASGTAVNPMSVTDIEQKFLRCAEPVLGRRAADRLLRSLNALDADVQIHDLMKDALS